MPDLDFAGGLLGGFQKKVADERARKDANNQFIVNTLISSGRVKDVNDLAPFLGDLGSKTGSGGGKRAGANGKQDPMGLIGMLVNPIFKKHAEEQQARAAGTSDQQVQGGGAQPPQGANVAGRNVGLFSEDEMQARAEAAKQRELNAQTQSKIAIEQAKPSNLQQKFVRYQGKDISAGWDPRTNKYYDSAGNELAGAVEKPQGKETGALAERTKQIAAKLGIDPTSDRAHQLAATQLEGERATKQQQASTRLNAYVAMSRQSLLTNTERYKEMQEAFPYTLALKMAGLEVAQMRPDLIKQSLEKGDLALETGRENLSEKYATAGTRQATGEARLKKLQTDKIDRDGQKEASKIVEAATRQAAALAGKKSSILMELGLEEDESAIRTRLIQEMSGGQDPEKVEALAKSRVADGPPAAAGGGGAVQHKVGDIVRTKDGKQHKILRLQSDGQLVLDPAVVP